MDGATVAAIGSVAGVIMIPVGWLLKTVIGNASKTDTFATKDELTAHREKVAENYVRREDYVPQITQVIERLDGIGQMVARLEERSKEGK